jgi:rhamnopyranosyl-N-acetylglucosaminyl-diphospho-decaprenol beta-1,3/1,4-galactofuranosyltransferase
MDNVAAVVVTFNRKALLGRCLDAILAQSRPVDRIFIVDNASTDGTPEFLAERGYAGNPVVQHVRLPVNTGSAGGFHEGMKRAHEAGYAWMWLMDDDGYPSPDCLAHLATCRTELDMVGPAVVRPDDPSRLTWTLRRVHPNGRLKTGQTVGEKSEDLVSASPGGVYHGFANLFNGVLISRRVTAKVGYALADLFIWGDENEYLFRVTAAGFRVGTCPRAIHFHPFEKPRAKSLWRFYYLYRNTFYIYRRYARVTHPPLLRPFVPFYASLKLLGQLPSTSPAYLWSLARGGWRALRGELVPFDGPGPQSVAAPR